MGKSFPEARLEKRLKLGTKDCTYGPSLSRGLARTWQDPLLLETAHKLVRLPLLVSTRRNLPESTEQSAKTLGAGDSGVFLPILTTVSTQSV